MMEKTLNQKYNDIVKTIFQKYFKPLHYKKENGNFRFIQEDGLGKIVNFQRSWCNNKDSCSFIINVGIYFEEGTTITDQKFKELLAQIRERPGTWWELDNVTDSSMVLAEICKEMEQYILPFLFYFDTKEKAVCAVLSGEYGLDYNTADLMIRMGYGKELLPRLMKNPVCYEKLLRLFQDEVKIPIFEDKQVYKVYLVLKGKRYNNNELNTFARVRGISRKKAGERLEADDRLLAQGDAMLIKKVSSILKGDCVGYVIEPEFPY